MNRSELQKEVVKKAMSDSEFRKQLLANPKETLNKNFKTDFPDEINVNVIEEDQNTVNIIVPEVSSELSDDDLENVAGGFSCKRKLYCICKLPFHW